MMLKKKNKLQLHGTKNVEVEKIKDGIHIPRVKSKEICRKALNWINETIAIFISSQDEFEAIEGWENPYYDTQTEAIEAIINSDVDPEIRFYLRIHPSLKGLKNTQIKELNELKSANLFTIPADSKIDSYELMAACEKNYNFWIYNGH